MAAVADDERVVPSPSLTRVSGFHCSISTARFKGVADQLGQLVTLVEDQSQASHSLAVGERGLKDVMGCLSTSLDLLVKKTRRLTPMQISRKPGSQSQRHDALMHALAKTN